jgi:hypothetical protein
MQSSKHNQVDTAGGESEHENREERGRRGGVLARLQNADHVEQGPQAEPRIEDHECPHDEFHANTLRRK